MRRLVTLGVALSWFAAGVIVSAGGAAAAVMCTNTISGTVSGDVEVPPGAGCDLNGANVRGDVLVDPGGILEFDGRDVVGGSILSHPTMKWFVARDAYSVKAGVDVVLKGRSEGANYL